jgi:hypothetical protein
LSATQEETASYKLSASDLQVTGLSYVSDIGLEAVQIDKGIDTAGREGIHTSSMISSAVDMIDTNGVGAELLHQSSITVALFSIDERIILDELISNTCIQSVVLGVIWTDSVYL